MKKVGILVIVCLLAVTGIMAAMAYTSAVVTNPGQMQILNTNKAYLRVYKTQHDGQVGYKDLVFYYEDGVGKLDFTRGAWGINGTRVGFQPGSIYEFNGIFRVQNGSAENIVMWMEAEGLTDYITITAGSTVLVENGQPTNNTVAMGPSGYTTINIVFDVPLDAAESGEVTLDELLEGTITLYAEPY